MKNDEIKKLNKLLGVANDALEETSEVTDTISPIVLVGELESTPDDFRADILSDYNATRALLRKLLLKGELALGKIIDVANDDGHPRAFEVASTLINTISAVSKDLMNLHKEVRELIPIEETQKTKELVTDQTSFIGSTHDLLKAINDKREKTSKEAMLLR